MCLPLAKSRVWRVCQFNINHVWIFLLWSDSVSHTAWSQVVSLVSRLVLELSCQEESRGHLPPLAETVRIFVSSNFSALSVDAVEPVPLAIWLPWCLLQELDKKQWKPMPLCHHKSRFHCVCELPYQEYCITIWIFYTPVFIWLLTKWC